MRPLLAFVLCGLVAPSVVGAPAKDPMNGVAERYAHLVLALGQHDPDYVDAFYGPTEWKTQAEKEKKSLNEIETEVHVLFFHTLPEIPDPEPNAPDSAHIDRAVDLATHEGYPGHHVYNSLLEKNLVRDRGWMEFSVYALFSPQSLIAEGTANFGRDVAFPSKTERMKFEKEVLFPAAGIDPARADEYYAVQDLMKELNYAGNEAARRLINGEIDEKGATEWLQKYAVMEPPRAQQRVKFIQRYRSYVINYNLGEDMVRRYIEKRSGNDPEKRWNEFGKLLASPRLPSGLE